MHFPWNNDYEMVIDDFLKCLFDLDIHVCTGNEVNDFESEKVVEKDFLSDLADTIASNVESRDENR